MRFSCCTDITEENLELLTKVKYEGIEPAAYRQLNPEKIVDDEIDDIKNLLESYNLKLASAFCLYPPESRLVSLDSSVLRRNTKYIKALVEVSSKVDCQTLTFGGAKQRNIPADIPKEKGLQILVELLKEGGKTGKDYGVRIAVEPINRFESNALNRFSEVIEIVRRVECEAVGVTADVYHMDIEETSISNSIREAGDLIWHTHISDSNRDVPGFGKIDFGRTIRILKEIGYDGYLSMELATLAPSYPNKTLTLGPEEALAKAKKHLESFS